jgi:hypothetical protein
MCDDPQAGCPAPVDPVGRFDLTTANRVIKLRPVQVAPASFRIGLEAMGLKNLAILMIVLLYTGPVVAQDNDAPGDETLFPGKFRNGWFGGAVVKLSSVNKEFGTIAGVRGGWIPKRSYSLGIGVYYLVTTTGVKNVVPAHPDSTLDIVFGYAGPELEYVNRSHKLIHYTICVFAGPGVIQYKDYEPAEGEDEEAMDRDLFFVFEPALNIMLNVHRLARLGFGISYRYVYGAQLGGIMEKNLRSPAAVVTLKLGRF